MIDPPAEVPHEGGPGGFGFGCYAGSFVGGRVEDNDGRLVHGLQEAGGAIVDDQRVILHLDCDEFFLQVHGLMDPSLNPIILARPCALWQYNDVISMNTAARGCGVQKHMQPQQAAALLKPAAGHLIHAFWRKWPGPRVNYRPYQLASWRMFTALEAALRGLCPTTEVVMERASLDECYLDVTVACGGCIGRGRALACRLQQALRDTQGLRVTAGCARSRLLAKLASTAAKLPPAAGSMLLGESCSRLMSVQDGMEGQVLRLLPAKKLPGLGGKGAQLGEMGATTIESLQAWSPEQLAAALGLRPEAADKVWRSCRGLDASPVGSACPPKSLVVTSWTTHTFLRDIAVKEHLGLGADAVQVGDGWVFEVHGCAGKSNDTRCRWILLSMAMDLVDKVQHTWLEWRLLPTKLTVGWQGCGTSPAPGPGFSYLSGETKSRTITLPVESQHAFAECPVMETSLAVPPPAASGHHGAVSRLPAHGPRSESSVHISANRTVTAEGPDVLQDAAYSRCVAVVVDAAASVLQAFVQEDAALGVDRRVAQLTLSVSAFRSRSSQRGIQAWLTRPASCCSPGRLDVPRSAVSLRHSASRTSPTKAVMGVSPLPAIAQSPREANGDQTAGNRTKDDVGSGTIKDLCGSGNGAPDGGSHRPPEAFMDSGVWDALPPEVREELCGDSALRDRQRGVPRYTAAATARGPHATPAPGGNRHIAGQPGDHKRAGRQLKRKALAAAGCAPISAFFKPQRKPAD